MLSGFCCNDVDTRLEVGFGSGLRILLYKIKRKRSIVYIGGREDTDVLSFGSA